MARRKKKARVKHKKGLERFLENVILIVLIILVVSGAAIYYLSQVSNLSEIASILGSVTNLIILVLVVFVLGVSLVKFRELIGQYKFSKKKQLQAKQFFMSHPSHALLRELQAMDWREFEYFLGELYTHLGYKVTVTEGSGDGGIDAHITKDGHTYILQAKRYAENHNVQRPEVQQFIGTMFGYSGGVFVTTSNYSPGAREFAKDFNQLQLVDGSDLVKLIEQSGFPKV